MPKPKLVNHLPLLNRPLAHWSLVETALEEAVTLPDGTTRDGAQDLATSIQDTDSSLLVQRNTLTTAGAGSMPSLKPMSPPQSCPCVSPSKKAKNPFC